MLECRHQRLQVVGGERIVRELGQVPQPARLTQVDIPFHPPMLFRSAPGDAVRQRDSGGGLVHVADLAADHATRKHPMLGRYGRLVRPQREVLQLQLVQALM